MGNEVLAKFVCHNICCLISAMYELGISPILVQAIMRAMKWCFRFRLRTLFIGISGK